MALTIIKATDDAKPRNLTMLIYGQPGVGKTSFAFTSSKPLLIDFDGLAFKSGNRKDFVQVTSWEEVRNITADDLKDYDTIIIDTVGKAQDYCEEYLLRLNPKFKTSMGKTISFWGALKTEFVGWFKQMNLLGKDVILIGHEKEEKNGELIQKRPDIAGGANGIVTSSVILLGYMQIQNKKRVVTFNNDDLYFTKNVGNPGLKDIIFEDFVKEPDTLKIVLDEVKEKLGSVSAETNNLISELNEYKLHISNINSIEELNLFYETMDKPNPKIEKQVKLSLKEKADNLEAIFDKTKMCFITLQELEMADA